MAVAKPTTHKLTAIEYAEQQLGVNYVFGAESPGIAFDCSGLVQYAYGKAGIKMPRTAAQQQAATIRISASSARPGDLVFFGFPAHHVGIYLGNGEFLEAPHPGEKVKIAHFDMSQVTFGRVNGPSVAVSNGMENSVKVAKNPTPYVSYGYVQDLANSVPEIKALLAKASKAGWDTQRFTDALRTTTWWKTHSDSAKKMIELSKSDPGEFRQQNINMQHHIEQIAAGLGVNLTLHQVNALASNALFNGQDDATLHNLIGGMYMTVPGSTGGQSVQLNQQIKALADAYGVPVTQAWVDGQVRIALKNGTGLEGATAQLTTMAKSLFPSLTKQLDAGQTVKDIAQPYLALMGQTLEIDPANIDVSDPTIQKALHGQLPSGTPQPAPTTTKGKTTAATPTATPLNDFAAALRSDPRWDKTANATASAYQMMHQLGQTFGFAS